MTTRDLVKAAQVRKARGADLAAVRPLAAVTDDIHAHLALWRLDGRVRLAGRHGVALAVEQKVVDQGLHVLLHGGAGRRRDLVVLDLDRAGGHLVQALVDDAQRLPELLHAAEVAVVAVAVDADGHVELDLAVGVVGLRLAHVPWHAGAAEHDTGEGVVECIRGGYNTNALCTADPDAVVGQELLGLVYPVTKLCRPLVDVV